MAGVGNSSGGPGFGLGVEAPQLARDAGVMVQWRMQLFQYLQA